MTRARTGPSSDRSGLPLSGRAFRFQALLDAREEFLCVNRFRDIRVHACLQAAVAVTIDGVRCKSDDRRASRARPALSREYSQ